VVTGGGGAPIYAYQGEPDLGEFLAAGAAEKVQLEHLVKPSADAADTPHHYVVVRVDGEDISLEVIGVDPGEDFKPYRSDRLFIGAVDPKPSLPD